LMFAFLGLFLAANTMLSTNENRSQVLRSASHVFGQTRAYLQYKIESVRNLLYSLATNADLQELFERSQDYYLREIGRWPIDSQSFEKLTYITNFNPDITAVRLYMKYGLASVFENDSYRSFQTAAQANWYHKVLRNPHQISWFSDGSPLAEGLSLHVVRGVFARENIYELTGLVQFDISRDMLRTTLGNALLTENTEAALIDSVGTTVYSVGSMTPQRAQLLWERIRDKPGGDFSAEKWLPVTVEGRRYLVGTQDIQDSDWTLLIALPERDIVRASTKPARQMLAVFLFIVPLTLFFAFLVSRSATKRIENLTLNMERVGHGDFTAALRPENRDEIGRLTEQFNFMLTEIDRHVQDNYNLGKEVKNLELRALQAQINPHFLYNTLDLINWISMRYEAHDIRSLVTSLSRFYKLTLNNGEDTTRLRDELDHAKAYVQIQNMRYEDAVRLEIDVAGSLLDCRVLKIILQPLVENSIVHGIMQKSEQRGTIRISARRENTRMSIVVQDDGVGMSAEMASRLRAGLVVSHDHHGYGVRNIDERLRLNYGPEYGLDYAAAPGGGTITRILLPLSAKL